MENTKFPTKAPQFHRHHERVAFGSVASVGQPSCHIQFVVRFPANRKCLSPH